MTIVRRAWIGDLEVTDYPYGLRFGADLGNPDSTVVTLESLLADGQIESLIRRLNRGMALEIAVMGADLFEVQQNEAALVLECDRRQNTFTVDLGDGYAEPMVFETTVIEPKRITGDGSDEQDMATLHLWSLSIQAQPFWRSATKVIDDAGTPPSSGGTVLLNCESTTGWAAVSNPTHTAAEYTVDGSVYVEGAGSLRSKSQYRYYYSDTNVQYSVFDKVSGLSLSTGTGGYFSFAVRAEVGDVTFSKVELTTSGGVLDIRSSLIAIKREADGFVHYVCPIDGGLTITAIEIWMSQTAVLDTRNYRYFWYDDFELLPAATTDHQIVKVHEVQGSARTTGSLHIAAATDVVALGHVLAITVPTDEIPAGFQPDGRRWITQGTTTTDTSALGGSYLTPDPSAYSAATGATDRPIFDVPVGMLTAGPYTVVALVKAESSSLTFGVQAQLRVASSNVGPTSAAETSPTGLTTGWQFVVVGTVYLPPLPVQNADTTTKVRLLFKGAKMAEVYMIPAWQVGGRPVADFSIVDCGTGTPAAGSSSSNLWIDSPSTDQPQGGWWRGPTSDRANAQSAWPDAKKPGLHVFPPGSLTHFLTSTGAAGPTSTLEYYPRNL